MLSIFPKVFLRRGAMKTLLCAVLLASGSTRAVDLRVTTADGPDPVSSGNNLTYTVSITNRGPETATGVSLTNLLSSRVSFISAVSSQGSCAHHEGAIHCGIGDLAAGAGARVSITVRTVRSGTATNVAWAFANEGESNPTDNRAVETTAVIVQQPALFNTDPIIMVEDVRGPGQPYPSTIPVTGMTGTVHKVTVTLNGISHVFPNEIDVLLVGPSGQSVVLMSDTGGHFGVSDLILTFDDAAPQSLPNVARIVAGTYRPTNIGGNDEFPPPAPASVPGAGLGVFRDSDPNGVWALYVVDDLPEDGGEIANGWSLQISTLDAIADLSLALSAAPEPVVVSSNLTYRIAVTNHGPAVATGVQIVDVLPPGVNFVSASSSVGVCSNNGSWVSCFPGNLGRLDSALMTITVAPTIPGLLTNTARVASTGDVDFLPGNNAMTLVTTVRGLADLAVAQTATPTPVAGGSLTYTVMITNRGPTTASGVRVTNALPPQVSFVTAGSSQGGCTHSNGLVLCDLGSLPAGGAAVLAITTRVNESGILTNTAQAGGNEMDPVPGNNMAGLETSVQPGADLGLNAAVSPSPAMLGEPLRLTLVVSNTGPDATAAMLTNVLPQGMAFVRAETEQGQCSHSGGTVQCDLGVLPARRSVAVVITGTPSVTGKLTNNAWVQGGIADPNPANNAIASDVLVSRASDLSVSAFVSAQRFEIGEPVTFFLQVTNHGPDLATRLQLTNRFSRPVRVRAAEASGGACIHVDDTLVCDLGGVLSGDRREITLVVEPTTTASLSITSLVSALEMDPNLSNNLTTASTFGLNRSGHFANTNAITIPLAGPADIYPSVIVVSNQFVPVDKVRVSFSRLTHFAPDDLDLLLVGPAGQRTLLMSDAGHTHRVVNIGLSLDPDASLPLPDATQISPGLYRPADYEVGSDPFPAPAPAGPYVADLSVFNGQDPNGAWSLYILDDTIGNDGLLVGGWSLSFASATPIADLAVSVRAQPSPVGVRTNVTFTLTVTNQGPAAASDVVLTNLLPPNVTLISASTSAGSCEPVNSGVRCQFVSLLPGDQLAVTVTGRVESETTLTNRVGVTAAEIDPQLANNAADVRVLVTPQPVTLFGSRWQGGSFALEFFGSTNRAYRVQASTNLVDWTDVGPAVLNQGWFEFVDPNASGFPARFYRVPAP